MKKIIFSLFLTTLFFSMPLTLLRAENDDLGFDSSLRYNIYFAGESSGMSVLNNVKIKGTRNWAGKTYLVVASYGLKLSEAEGFILLDSVISILPDGNFNVRHLAGIKN